MILQVSGQCGHTTAAYLYCDIDFDEVCIGSLGIVLLHRTDFGLQRCLLYACTFYRTQSYPQVEVVILWYRCRDHDL